MHNAHGGIQHYRISSLLYLHTIKDKYIAIYNEFISQLWIHAKAVRILAKGHLLISLVTPLKLQENISSVKETLIKTNPDNDIVIKRLHLYYSMKLVTFGIDQKKKLNYTVSNFCTALLSATANFISVRDSPSPYSRSQH